MKYGITAMLKIKPVFFKTMDPIFGTMLFFLTWRF